MSGVRPLTCPLGLRLFLFGRRALGLRSFCAPCELLLLVALADLRLQPLEDFTSDKTQLDRELAQMSSQSQVDSDLERLKAEVGKGDEQKQLAGGAEGTQTESTPAEEKQT